MTTATISLQRLLTDARARTLEYANDLTGPQLLGPRLDIVNPPLWEIGHVGWFQERWCLRHAGGDALAPSMLKDADALYDSAAVAHGARWTLPLPSLDATLRYLDAVLSRVCERLSNAHAGDDIEYYAQLAALHEEMHAEAFAYTRQTLGCRAPLQAARDAGASRTTACSGDAEIAGGELMLGAATGERFVFDNEKWAHPVNVQAFGIARAAVTNGEYAAFVDDGGYSRPELWCAEGWAWRILAQAQHPVYWLRMGDAWLERRYDRIEPLELERALVHVNWYEARAYCRWARRRLPNEAEWELAAATVPGAGAAKRRYPWGNASPSAHHANLYGAAGAPVEVGAYAAGDSAWGLRQMIGNVWEWTESSFGPYPGFVADPYKEYSQPWFGTHRVLRGGSYATRAALIRNTWRNFYTPDRRDVFAGFRTCAL